MNNSKLIFNASSLQKALSEISENYRKKPNAENKIKLALNICSIINRGDCNQLKNESPVFDILQILSNDPEATVRKTIAEEITYNPEIPKKIILKLAYDLPEISNIILTHSPLLDKDDLLSLASNAELSAMIAIANRRDLYENVVKKLLEYKNEDIGLALISNRSIHTKDFLPRFIKAFNYSDNIVSEAIENCIEDEDMKEKFYEYAKDQKYGVNKKEMDEKETKTTTIQLKPIIMERVMEEGEIKKIVEDLYESERLTVSVIVKALCNIDIRFVCNAFATASDNDYLKVKTMLVSGDSQDFMEMLEEIGWPHDMKSATYVLARQLVRGDGINFSSKYDYMRHLVYENVKNGNYARIPNFDYIIRSIESNSRKEENKKQKFAC